MTRVERGVLAGVALVAVLVRLLYVLEVHDHPYYDTPLVDAADYHGRAMLVMRGEGLGERVFYKAPAYPFLLGQLYRLTGPRIEVAYTLQMLGGVLSTVLVADLGLLWFGTAAGLLAGLLLALYAPLAYFENQALMASPALTASVLATWILVRWRSTWSDLAAGAVLGLAVQLVPLNVTLVGALVAWLLFGKGPGLAALRRVVLVLVPVALALLPTLHHNRLGSGQLVPISVNGGINFFIGNNPDYDTTVAIRPGLRWEELTKRFGAQEDPIAWDRRFYQAAREFIREHPGDYAKLVFKKLILFWNARIIDRNQDSSVMRQESHVLRFGLPWGVLGVLGWVGFATCWRRLWRTPIVWLTSLQMLGVVAYFVTTRYRLQVVPWLALAAAVGLEQRLPVGRGKHRRSLIWTAVVLAFACFLVLPDHYHLRANDFGRPDLDRAEVLARKGDRLGALAAFETAVARHPLDADTQFRYGEHLERLGQREDAIRAYQRASELAPASYKPALALGAAYILAGDLDLAWQALAESERRGDPLGRTQYNMGLVREEQARLEEALVLYERALSMPDAASERVLRHLAAARVLVLLGRAANADEHYRQAEALSQDSVRVILERGEAWLKAGEPARALAIVQNLEGLDNDARGQFLRARALVKLGRIPEARAAAARACNLAPERSDFRDLYQRLEQLE